ncbi:MAG: AMP-binding protein [Candidatus Bathyarchaeota archaeon]|nr:MAG: AMP-binding protein [Candidatus Bathyarchaeota archaeon]
MDRHRIPDYKSLIKRSTEDVEWFWNAAVDELGVEWFKTPQETLNVSAGPQWAKWFTGGRLNVSHNCVNKHAASWRRNKTAFIWVGEDGEEKHYSYWKLNREVNRFANALKTLGVGEGDTVGMYIPMFPETIIALFATMKIGAIAVPIFSGYSPKAVRTRLQSAESRVLVTADGYYRRGKIIKLKESADEAVDEVDTIETVIVVQRSRTDVLMTEGRDVLWSELMQRESTKCETVPVDAEAPALLLYTSGTTAKPKGTVISQAGALLQSAKEIHFNLDLKEDDVFFWITDIGWMMGPWQIIGVQHLGGTHLIFEGAPDYPKPDRLWDLIERHGVTTLGGSATVFRMLKKYGDEYVKAHDLSSLRMLGNTGESIDPDTWQWLHRTVAEQRCPFINLSGGTEIFGCFLLPLPIMPLKPSTLGGPGLGMDIDVFDDDGRSLREQVGYLVCKKPAPSMTRGFWKEPQRYIETYWSRWKDVWYHGDWASVDRDGFWFLHGRADDVIKVAGKRIGPAEIESILNQHQTVYESACIGLPHEIKGEEIMCFAVLKPRFNAGAALKDELSREVVANMGKPFKPSDISFVNDLPRTRSGKIVRRLIRDAMLNKEFGDMSSLENPDSLKEIKRLKCSS